MRVPSGETSLLPSSSLPLSLREMVQRLGQMNDLFYIVNMIISHSQKCTPLRDAFDCLISTMTANPPSVYGLPPCQTRAELLTVIDVHQNLSLSTPHS
jgi:hypothetical protein